MEAVLPGKLVLVKVCRVYKAEISALQSELNEVESGLCAFDNVSMLEEVLPIVLTIW